MTSSEWTKYQMKQLMKYDENTCWFPAAFSSELMIYFPELEERRKAAIKEEDERYRNCYIDLEGCE